MSSVGLIDMAFNRGDETGYCQQQCALQYSFVTARRATSMYMTALPSFVARIHASNRCQVEAPSTVVDDLSVPKVCLHQSNAAQWAGRKAL